jgi:hypothetical protein
MEVHMKKALLLILAVGISDAAVLSAANTSEMANVLTTVSDNADQYYAADYRLERRAYRYIHRRNDYPYYRGYASLADPWWPGSGGRCSYGSYVACVYTNAFCGQRCY